MAINKIPESQLPTRSVSETDYVRVVGADGKSYRVPKTDFNGGGGGGALTQDTKQALLQCFAHTAWTDDQGQDYYDDLEDALYPFDLLSSITAVYTQSGTVYDTDSLDDLKADLVVTGNYSDGTYNQTTKYTLSGTLTAGTSTITVTYGGKTATFTVTVTQSAATLTSISCVYTQGGTVYTSDTLDSLKEDLVVTAHYSDSTTATVPSTDYTLSGTLTAGTSTVTVSYSGKTTTFTVTVTQDSRQMLYNWDFTQSLIDSVSSKTAILGSIATGHNPTRDSNGVSVQFADAYIDLGQIYETGITVEVDFGAMSRQGTQNGRLLMVGNGSASGGLGTGFIYRNNNTWNWYASGSWDTAISGTTNPDYFSNKTLKAVFDADGHMSVYDGNALLGTSTRAFLTSAGTSIQLGAYSGNGGHTCFYNMIVRAVRVYKEIA